MATTKVSPLDKQLDIVKKQITPLRGTALQEAESLVINSEDDYLRADTLRAGIKSAISIIESKIDPIIEDIRPGLDKLYKLKREAVGPLSQADQHLLNKMKSYRREEQQKLLAAQREQQRLTDLAEENRRKAELARTPQQAKRLETKAEEIQIKADTVVTTPLQAAHSTTRTVKRWKLADLGTLLQAVIDGNLPEECIQLNTLFINQSFSSDPAAVAKWPGIAVYDDVQIVRTRQ